jgi:hypothetical protein
VVKCITAKMSKRRCLPCCCSTVSDSHHTALIFLFVTGRRSQLQGIRRATFTPSQYTGSQHQRPSLPDIRERPRSTSINSFASLASYLSSRVSFAITRERAYSSASTVPTSNPVHDLDTGSECGEETADASLSLQAAELIPVSANE